MLLKYNVIAVAGAAIGMLNTVLTWKLFGATQSADVWLLGLAVVAILGLLVLMGVEQFLVFYTDIMAQKPGEAGGFASTAVVWALLSGVLFALCCLGAAGLLVSWFAGGLSAEAKQSAVMVLTLLLPQVAAAPLLHVTRSILNAHGKYGQSYSLSLIIPSALLIALMFFLVIGGGGVRELGWSMAAAAVLQLAICLVMAYQWCGSLPAKITKDFLDLVKNSVTMRIGHSFHNFFVGLIINSALSHQATGMIAIFQYAKRFADGVFTVTIGPHLNIYLARQALAWSERDHSQHRKNIKTYFSTISPLFLAAALLVLLFMPLLLQLLGRDEVGHAIGAIQMTYAAFTIWQGVIAAEAIFVGVVMTARQSFILWGVNGLFIGSFYLYSTLIPAGSPAWYLAAVALVAQLISFACYGLAARFLARKQFVQ